MGNPVIIIMGLVAMCLVGISYYIVIPTVFNTKASFDARVTDPAMLERGDQLYSIVGIFPLIFLGIIFLNMYTKSVRQHSSDAFG